MSIARIEKRKTNTIIGDG